MGIQEQEIIDLFREMQTERHGAKVTIEGLAVLTAARLLKRAMEKCTIEICGSIEQTGTGPELSFNLSQARAILEMDIIAYSEGQGPEAQDHEGWDAMVELAEAMTGEKAIRVQSLEQKARHQDAAETRRSRMGEAQREVRQDLAEMGE